MTALNRHKTIYCKGEKLQLCVLFFQIEFINIIYSQVEKWHYSKSCIKDIFISIETMHTKYALIYVLLDM